MKHRYIVFILILFYYSSASAIPADSLVKFSDLTLKSEAEKATFLKFNTQKESADIIDLLLAPYDSAEGFNSVQAHKKIEECVQYLKQETQNKPEAKKIKIIYEYVHKTFFKVYKLKNSFSDIFSKGEYNCVSASAMYAIIFSKLDVPYQIKEKPQHVYLVADPQGDKILIESTSPENGYYQFSSGYVEKFVKNLYDSKIITKEEYTSTPVTDLFNKHFFSSEDISLTELAGLQYSNYCIFEIEDKNYDKAIAEIKKAYFIFPAERNKYILKSALLYQVSNNNYSDQEHVSDLAVLCRFNNLKDEEVSDESIKNEFIRIIQTQLIKNSDFEKFDQSYTMISGAINDTALRNDISFDYNYELARLGYNKQSLEYELKHLSAAYLINPRHADLQGIIIDYFVRSVEKVNDAQSILDLMKAYENQFGFLSDRKEFITVRANCLLDLAYQQFSLNNVAGGEKYLKQFETVCEEKKITEPGVAFVERAYSVAASIYYKKGNYAKAKQLFKTGLLYAPNSFALKQRLSQLQ